MKGNKRKIGPIFDDLDVSASQDIYLQRCGFAVPGQPPPDSDPSILVSPPPVNDGIASHRASDDSESDSLLSSGYDAVESQAVRFVSPQETVDLEEDATDPTVEVMTEEQRDVPVESNERLGSPANEDGGGKKLQIPLREVVKAIVMNSRNTAEKKEEDKEIEKTSFVQILLKKGFKF